MKTFLNVLIVIVAVVIAIKLLPVALFVLGGVTGLLGLLAAIGIPLLVLGIVVGLVVVLLTSPLWVPVLLLAGLIALLRRPRAATVSA